MREIGAPGAADHALVFTARVGDLDINGCDFLHVGEDGLIDEFTVMLRPLRAVTAFAQNGRRIRQRDGASRTFGLSTACAPRIAGRSEDHRWMARFADDTLIVRGEQRSDASWLFTIRYLVVFDQCEIGLHFSDSVRVSGITRVRRWPSSRVARRCCARSGS